MKSPEGLPNQTFPAPKIDLQETPLPFAQEELVRFGDIPIFYATWGQPFSNKKLVNHFRQAPFWSDSLEYMVKNVGFDGGFRHPSNFGHKNEEFHHRQTIYSAELARRVIKERGWDGVDILVVASASCRANTPELAAEILKKEGIAVDQALFYGQACNGAMAAIVDLSQRGELRGARAVVVGMETLSGAMISGEWVEEKDIPLFATFGNGGGAIAWKVGEEIRRPLTGQTIVDYDKDKVISSPQIYGLPPENERTIPYPWYQFVNSSGEIIGYEEARREVDQYFALSSGGVFLLMPESETGYGEMRGRETLRFFTETGRMPRLIWEVQKEYQEKFQEQYGKLNPSAIYHPASLPVIVSIGRKYVQLALKEMGLGELAVKFSKMGKEERQRELQKMGVDFQEISFPWLMQRMGINNISAGTSFIQWAEMAKNGYLDPDKPTMLVTMGIGSVRQAWVVEIPAV